MLSISTRSRSHSTNTIASSKGSKRSNHTQSQTSSQKEALKRFAKELHRYAEQTNAKGKIPLLTPSSKSPATLHTISALLPYRREFKAAGLAVTSKDQAPRPAAKEKLTTRPSRHRNWIGSDGKPLQMSQMDGKEDTARSACSSSEVSFAGPGSIDEWRYALIDRVPSQVRGSRQITFRKGKGICLPCFPSRVDGRDSVQENVKRSLGVASTTVKSALSQRSKSKSKGRIKAPSHIPMPLAVLEPAEPSPRHLCDGFQGMQPLDMHLRPTGYRQPSMTVSQPNGHLESCHSGHSYTHPDAEIHKHNPRPTTTQYLHPEAAVGPRAGPRQYRPVRPEMFRHRPPELSSHFANGVSLPTFSVPKLSQAALPPPLRHTVSHIPARPEGEQWTLDVRNPTKPSAASIVDPGKILPSEPGKKRTSASTKRRTKLLASRHIRPAIPVRASSILQSLRSTEQDHERRVTDRQVLRGLHVATSAACDEEVDAYVADKTGLRIRQFLADLVVLETCWNDTRSVDDKEQRARQRRAQIRKLKQHMRRSREIRQASGHST